MRQEMFNGILNASSEKRYQHFLNETTASEYVWMVDCGNDTLLSPEVDGIVYYMAWSEKEFAEYYLKNMKPDLKCEIVSIEIHDFCHMLKTNKVMFMISATDKDAWVVSSEELCQNLEYELDRIEKV